MLRTNSAIAIIVAIVLVGGSIWYRFNQPIEFKANIASYDDGRNDPEYLSFEKATLESLTSLKSTATQQTSSLPLDQYDLIARGLFSDYVGLASQGQTTPENLDAIANKYAESIFNNTSLERNEKIQIIIVPDTEENFSYYGQNVGTIRNKYRNLVETNAYIGNTDIGSPNFSAFMNAMGKLYRASAKELLVLAVPTSLAENHRELVNNYLENADAMEILAKINADPVSAYTALNTQTRNTREETNLLLNIQNTLIAHGIILNIEI